MKLEHVYKLSLEVTKIVFSHYSFYPKKNGEIT